MARESDVSKGIYRRHIRLFRLLNDLWIFTESYCDPSLIKEPKSSEPRKAKLRSPTKSRRARSRSIANGAMRTSA